MKNFIIVMIAMTLLGVPSQSRAEEPNYHIIVDYDGQNFGEHKAQEHFCENRDYVHIFLTSEEVRKLYADNSLKIINEELEEKDEPKEAKVFAIPGEAHKNCSFNAYGLEIIHTRGCLR